MSALPMVSARTYNNQYCLNYIVTLLLLLEFDLLYLFSAFILARFVSDLAVDHRVIF